MLPLFLLAAADPETPVDAERAFYAAAQRDGQWTAFRRFMADGATVFTPQPVEAAKVLPKKDPAIAVQWWPGESYVSCDGSVAVNTGPWVRPDSVGYFTTVWERQGDGRYKWIVDAGDALPAARALPEEPRVRRAACNFPRGMAVGVIFEPDGARRGEGVSKDGTLAWAWRVMPDGSRSFTAKIWTGRRFETVVRDDVAAPPAG
ncbi:hypothetical protein [Sphingomonas sp.]|uniref:hypothetical protein n=1 Tax=Sphingomonas sp. TaxID=28214 RepID=UPI001B2E80B2|nr:hypothetical protein [Sphingomonas sp.]MBO9713048.1 hypothetical protein [Sphingomonas sp.]